MRKYRLPFQPESFVCCLRPINIKIKTYRTIDFPVVFMISNSKERTQAEFVRNLGAAECIWERAEGSNKRLEKTV